MTVTIVFACHFSQPSANANNAPPAPARHGSSLHHATLCWPATDPRLIPRARPVSPTLLLSLSPYIVDLMRVVPRFAPASLVLALLRTVSGSLFVVNPTQQTVCHGGKSCPVEWLDDGEGPLLTTMGPCYVALFAGNEKLIQHIEPVDVSATHSLTFTPNPFAGPDSHTYYIAFTSINSSDSPQPLQAFSPFFTLDGMSGSFNSPVPELTSTIPAPSSLLTAQPNPISTSLLYGTTSSSTPTTTSPSPQPSSSGPGSSPTSPSSTPSPTATSSRSNAATRQCLPLWAITLVGFSISFFV